MKVVVVTLEAHYVLLELWVQRRYFTAATSAVLGGGLGNLQMGIAVEVLRGLLPDVEPVDVLGCRGAIHVYEFKFSEHRGLILSEKVQVLCVIGRLMVYCPWRRMRRVC